MCTITSILVTVEDVKLRLTKGRLAKKKYMGIWRWESEPMARMMSIFPTTVTRYMDRNT